MRCSGISSVSLISRNSVWTHDFSFLGPGAASHTWQSAILPAISASMYNSFEIIMNDYSAVYAPDLQKSACLSVMLFFDP